MINAHFNPISGIGNSPIVRCNKKKVASFMERAVLYNTLIVNKVLLSFHLHPILSHIKYL